MNPDVCRTGASELDLPGQKPRPQYYRVSGANWPRAHPRICSSGQAAEPLERERCRLPTRTQTSGARANAICNGPAAVLVNRLPTPLGCGPVGAKVARSRPISTQAEPCRDTVHFGGRDGIEAEIPRRQQTRHRVQPGSNRLAARGCENALCDVMQRCLPNCCRGQVGQAATSWRAARRRPRPEWTIAL